ncbi:MAG: hypothetical protein LBH59_10825 [Planctomycetaceae bacterium]|nr:hypothetical protein [Planctomycetaceae bacterium]
MSGKIISCRHQFIPKPVWAVGFALEQTLRDATLPVFSLLILKRLQHNQFNFGTRKIEINNFNLHAPKFKHEVVTFYT